LDVTIEGLQLMPDHVHVFVSVPPNLAPHRLPNQLNGFTSRMLRLWSRSYHIGTIGPVAAKTINAYIEAQRT
jgi:putative transposase